MRNPNFRADGTRLLVKKRGMKLQDSREYNGTEDSQEDQYAESNASDSILKQIHSAFDESPELDQVFHGVRRIKLGKHGSRSSLFFSKKCGGFIPVESRLELRHCYQLEANKKVKRYRSQAVKVPYCGRQLVPDFLVESTDGTFEIHEIKVSARLEDQAQRLKLQFISDFLLTYGVPYLVITEKDFPKPCVEKNVAMLYDRGGRLSASDLQLAHVSGLVRSLPLSQRTIGGVRMALKIGGLQPYLLEAALFTGVVGCNLSSSISTTTLITVPV